MTKSTNCASTTNTHDTCVDMQAAIEAGTVIRHEGVTNPMASYSVQLSAAVPEEARNVARHRGMTVGAWLREAAEAAVAQARSDVAVPISVLLTAVEEYRHRTAA